MQAAVNRVVPVNQLRRVMAWIREADFRSVNVDLICGLPLQPPECFQTTLELVRKLRPDRISMFSFADLPEQRQRLTMLENANRLLLSCGHDPIDMDQDALSTDNLAILADLQAFAADGLLILEQRRDHLKVNVTREGRWLIRTIAAVFDPLQRLQACGSRLV